MSIIQSPQMPIFGRRVQRGVTVEVTQVVKARFASYRLQLQSMKSKKNLALRLQQQLQTRITMQLLLCCIAFKFSFARPGRGRKGMRGQRIWGRLVSLLSRCKAVQALSWRRPSAHGVSQRGEGDRGSPPQTGLRLLQVALPPI